MVRKQDFHSCNLGSIPNEVINKITKVKMQQYTISQLIEELKNRPQDDLVSIRYFESKTSDWVVRPLTDIFPSMCSCEIILSE